MIEECRKSCLQHTNITLKSFNEIKSQLEKQNDDSVSGKSIFDIPETTYSKKTELNNKESGFVNYIVMKLLEKGILKKNPIISWVSAVSCGIYKGNTILDLEYEEDSNSDADVNFIMNDKDEIIEVQGTAEGKPFSFSRLAEMNELASDGIKQLISKQKEALKID